jgi:glycosyltransferase involved in cell wall biosynthesis
MPPLVSVLTTAYNREKYIAECIESVLASTFQDYEYVIVDDCSSDRSYAVALEYAKKDSRIRIYRNEKNLGDYPNRNRTAELACGKYLKYLDSDDVLYPHGLRVMANAITRFPEAGIALSQNTDENSCYPVCLSPEEAYREHFFRRDLFGRSPGSAIIKAAAFWQIGGFSGQRFVGDTELWLRLAARFPMVKMPRDLVWDRTHQSKESVYEAEAQNCELRTVLVLNALKSSECPLDESERRRATIIIRKRAIKQAMRWLLYRRRAIASFRLFRGAWS